MLVAQRFFATLTTTNNYARNVVIPSVAKNLSITIAVFFRCHSTYLFKGSGKIMGILVAHIVADVRSAL